MIPLIERANAWIVSRDTGTSSKALWAVMMDTKGGTSHPSDGSDIGRCIRLLDAIPEWRERLPEMAGVSKYWAALVANWSELEALYRSDERDQLYDRMRQVLDPIEIADPNVIRMGQGVSIRFGAA